MSKVGQAFADSMRGVEPPSRAPMRAWITWVRRTGGLLLAASALYLVALVVRGSASLKEVVITLLAMAVASAIAGVGWLFSALRGQRGGMLAFGCGAMSATIAVSIAAVWDVELEQLWMAELAIAVGIAGFALAHLSSAGFGLARVLAVVPLAAAAVVVIGVADHMRLGWTYDALWIVALCGVAVLGVATAFVPSDTQSAQR